MRQSMEYLNWELSILSRAVAYSNLSGAASHVGLSQPQLSRIVARLESNFGLNLLDREARRKSAWTPAAFRLVEAYQQAFQSFQTQIQRLSEGAPIQNLRVATLEGLIPIAVDFCNHIFRVGSVRVIDLQVLDLNELEEQFFKKTLHLAFTAREPGRKKFSHLLKLAYQTLDEISSSDQIEVLSSFEFGTRGLQRWSHVQSELPQKNKVLISNSLVVRKTWLHRFGGHGTIPSEPRKTREALKTPPHLVRATEVPVLLLGSEELPKAFWEKVTKFKFLSTERH